MIRFVLPLSMALGIASAQAPDPELASYIGLIRAVDNHAHPMRLLLAGEKNDPDVDALPGDGIEEGPSPVRGRPDNPEYVPIWRELYGYPYNDATAAHRQELEILRARTIQAKGADYPVFILDQMGIETMFSNRIAMGGGLAAPRFRWIAFVDALMYPLDNSALKRATPDRAVFFADEERLLKRYLESNRPPPTLDAYTSQIVTGTIEKMKRDGAVGVKFEIAYLRSLDVEEAPREAAAAIYARYIRGGVPPTADYKKLQDYLFRHIAMEAGRLGLPIQIHTQAGGLGSYFVSAGANPLLLEPLFNDPVLRKTKFILIHTGEPWNKLTRAMFAKPNVYGDISAQTTTLYPRALAALIRDWLEQYPERVLFGTDAFPMNDKGGWEETGYLATITARKALAIALTGMLEDGEITRQRAHELAQMVMRDNALGLYGLK
jgi:predicted TIM-barrel fold metal-dependent hydrolase